MAVASHLRRPTRSSDDPGRVSLLIWPCSDWGLPCHACCQARGGLLPHRFTLTLGSNQGRSVFCGPFRRLTAPRRYLAVCPRELGLSSARHSNRHAATIAPYRHPAGKVPVLEGSGQVSPPFPPSARAFAAGGPGCLAPGACRRPSRDRRARARTRHFRRTRGASLPTSRVLGATAPRARPRAPD